MKKIILLLFLFFSLGGINTVFANNSTTSTGYVDVNDYMQVADLTGEYILGSFDTLDDVLTISFVKNEMKIYNKNFQLREKYLVNGRYFNPNSYGGTFSLIHTEKSIFIFHHMEQFNSGKISFIFQINKTTGLTDIFNLSSYYYWGGRRTATNIKKYIGNNLVETYVPYYYDSNVDISTKFIFLKNNGNIAIPFWANGRKFLEFGDDFSSGFTRVLDDTSEYNSLNFENFPGFYSSSEYGYYDNKLFGVLRKSPFVFGYDDGGSSGYMYGPSLSLGFNLYNDDRLINYNFIFNDLGDESFGIISALFRDGDGNYFYRSCSPFVFDSSFLGSFQRFSDYFKKTVNDFFDGIFLQKGIPEIGESSPMCPIISHLYFYRGVVKSDSGKKMFLFLPPNPNADNYDIGYFQPLYNYYQYNQKIYSIKIKNNIAYKSSNEVDSSYYRHFTSDGDVTDGSNQGLLTPIYNFLKSISGFFDWFKNLVFSIVDFDGSVNVDTSQFDISKLGNGDYTVTYKDDPSRCKMFDDNGDFIYNTLSGYNFNFALSPYVDIPVLHQFFKFLDIAIIPLNSAINGLAGVWNSFTYVEDGKIYCYMGQVITVHYQDYLFWGNDSFVPKTYIESVEKLRMQKGDKTLIDYIVMFVYSLFYFFIVFLILKPKE